MALLVVFVATVVEGLRLPLRDWLIWKYWPIYLLVPVVVFLLLQLLQFAVKRDDASLRRVIQGGGPGNSVKSKIGTARRICRLAEV